MPSSESRATADDVAALVDKAASGDQQAWNELVDEFSGLIWSIAIRHRLSRTDAADVVQTTWLKLLEHLGTLREKRYVGAWLATTARRESLLVLRASRRVAPTDDDWSQRPDSDPARLPEAAALRLDRDQELWRAFGRLPDPCQRLLRAVACEAWSYEEIAAGLGMRMGSIGPTRGRCLERLRRNLATGAVPEASLSQ
jgi:RNA polymerase sigma factor (sigma-70 family)